VSPTGSTVTYATTFTYDALNRPTAVAWDPAPAVTAPAAGPLVTFGHSYDRTNRRIGQTVTDNTWLAYPTGAPSTTSYTANELNQYSAVTGLTPSYSANGNLTGDGTYTYGYDAENRLVSATGAGNIASYAYDGRGWRKRRTVNGTTTISVTDADNREVLEYDGSNGAILRWYAYGVGPNDVLNQTNVPGGTRSVFLPDIQGSVIATYSSAGTLVKAAYLAYGGSAAAASPFGYTGQRLESESGKLYYYRARHYSTALGRFHQTDPTGYRSGANLYAYVGNDPLNATDPTGLAADAASGGGRNDSGWNSGSLSPIDLSTGSGGLNPRSGDFGTAGAGPSSWSAPVPSTSSVPSGTVTPSTSVVPVTPTVTLPSGSPTNTDSGFTLAGDNQRENKQVRDIVVELGLTKVQQRQLHDEITGRGYSYHEIKVIAIEMFGTPGRR
ncbi:RHS repeat-associated core domain-containing protein, partial [Reyranella sp.]|uniref:RHS repeat-associated core domain-containing protein n=1 Tax=Reyranella sp. TaxID=1929291 RepID=UPI00378375AF